MIVLRKDATVKILDMVVPVMAVCYFAITILIIVMNLGSLPGVFARIFEEAFGFRQAAAGSFGTVLMNGIKRGLFSNEAGSGSAPCAAAAAECDQPVKSRIGTGARGICGYDRDLQLYSILSCCLHRKKKLQDFPEWIFCRQQWNIILAVLV